ncbi:hypothetical protein DPMN_058769 [Dreissena polymorpha]|uniref:Uncharacterized protein n=1 Tax=Dreissena polymorpha TaxID=45954 RepID=A0A9D4C2U0_DREPO|nr:hypothetical protein DPMN_058769 [Dreissena polymorpha]
MNEHKASDGNCRKMPKYTELFECSGIMFLFVIWNSTGCEVVYIKLFAVKRNRSSVYSVTTPLVAHLGSGAGRF